MMDIQLHDEKMGAIGMAGFIRLIDSGHGDYTKDRHQWLDCMDLDDVVAQIKQAGQKP